MFNSLEEFLFFNWIYPSFSLFNLFENILLYLGVIIPLLIAVAFFTLIERKIMASIQRRHGPNVVGFFGILQPFADGLKLLLKESIVPTNANKGIFLFAPILTFFLSLIGWNNCHQRTCISNI